MPSEFRNRVSIHWGAVSPGYSYLIERLGVGESWVDNINGGTITFIGASSAGADVSISYNCVHNDPSVTIAPASQSTKTPGQTLNYNVSVKNNDSSICSAASFALNPQVPAGFAGTFTPSTLTVVPGATATSVIAVTSSTASADGTYGFGASASALDHNAVVGNANYVLDLTPPSIPSISSISYKSKGKTKGVSLAWTASTDALTGLGSYMIYRNGVRIATVPVSPTSYRDPNGARGMQYQVSALDKAGNESAKSAPVIVP